MAVEVKHSTVVAVPDDGTSPVGTDEWNAAHALNLTGPALLGREAASQGAAAEITIGSGLVLAAGVLSATGGGGGDGLGPDGDKGDVTVGGTGTTLTIDANAVTYAKMQDVSATQRVLGRNTAGSGDPEEVTLSQLLDWIGSAARGDILYRGAAAWARLAAGTSGQCLRTGGAAGDPSWTWPNQFNQSTAQQGAGFAADTYLTGSFIVIPAGGLKVGTRYRLVFDVSKTAAGTAAPVITVRVGTAGSTADTGRATLTFLAQTAAADDGRFEVLVTVRATGGTAVLQAVGTLTHRLQITGLANLPSPTVRATSAAFDITPAGTGIGVSVNGGASASWTVQLVQATLENLN